MSDERQGTFIFRRSYYRIAFWMVAVFVVACGVADFVLIWTGKIDATTFSPWAFPTGIAGLVGNLTSYAVNRNADERIRRGLIE